MGASVSDEATLLEHIQISPAPGGADKSYPLSFLDISWLVSPPVHQLCFYEFPLSKSHFTQTLVPNLKQSLSITLNHFFPFAGNLIVYPYIDPNHLPRKPEIRYVDGQDSVSLTVAEYCAKDITYLAGNHARKAHEFYPLVPRLGDIINGKDSTADHYIKVAALAIQVTLFPNRGICIGVTHHHAVCDGKVITNFIKAWASITKFAGDTEFVASATLPVFDRSVIKDPNCLETLRWGEISRTRIPESQPRHVSISTTSCYDKVRASFILTRDQINKVKKSILGLHAHGRTFSHISSFTIVCGLVWACLTKGRDAVGMYNQADDEREQFVCAVDCRARLDPPVPTSYFGNCLVPCIVKVEDRKQLLGEEGVFKAIELIGVAIHERLERLFDGAESWGKDLGFGPPTMLGVAGSPKFNAYDADFGWGQLSKYEIISTDYDGAMSLSECKESKDDIQIGLSLAKIQMDVFQDIFNKELNSLLLGH